jgi:hypothetical protein
MVSRTKHGLLMPEDEFAKLRPFRDQLLTMSQAYRPGGPEYMALSRVLIALDDASTIVMNKPSFFLVGLHRT